MDSGVGQIWFKCCFLLFIISSLTMSYKTHWGSASLSVNKGYLDVRHTIYVNCLVLMVAIIILIILIIQILKSGVRMQLYFTSFA